MSAYNQGSGPRSNRYSEDRFTNWSEYEPWFLEAQSVFKRFDGRIAKHPTFPKIIEIAPSEGFVHPCTAREVESKLMICPVEFFKDLRAVFILSGTKKQMKAWGRSAPFHGYYWNRCVFLHAWPFSSITDVDWLHRYYIKNVLMHEIGHHLDVRNITKKEREKFAEQFALLHG